jgi:putative component of toxin-antitoxin plasmid stabilization module
MIEVRLTADFTKWLDSLRDTAARLRVVARIRRVEIGNIGDASTSTALASFASITVPAIGSIS